MGRCAAFATGLFSTAQTPSFTDHLKVSNYRVLSHRILQKSYVVEFFRVILNTVNSLENMCEITEQTLGA